MTDAPAFIAKPADEYCMKISMFPASRGGRWRLGALLAVLLAIVLFVYVPAALHYARYAPQEGDFIFQSLPRAELVRAIEGISGSKYSHVGLVVRKDGGWYVREAAAHVADTPLFIWIARGRGGDIDVYRLQGPAAANIPAFVAASARYLGRPYDYRYSMDDAAIYCSELLYKAYYDATGVRLGKLRKLGDLNWRPYVSTIEQYEGGPVPLGRDMITPYELSRAGELAQVLSTY